MEDFYSKVRNATDVILSRIPGLAPDVGVLTGTGLSETLNDLDISHVLRYDEIPHFPKSTVAGHKGQLVRGRLRNKEVLVFQGRFHLYEGYSPQDVTFPVRLLQALKTKVLILSNAAGGINLNFNAGDIMGIRDHINLTGKNPLLGPDVPGWGLRFPDMTRVWDPDLLDLTARTANEMGIPMHTGVYTGLLGPSLETPAETRFLKAIGGDAVGFSTVMEAIAGVHAGMRLLGLSLITNINDPDAPEETTLEDVVKTAEQATKKMNRLLSGLIPKIV